MWRSYADRAPRAALGDVPRWRSRAGLQAGHYVRHGLARLGRVAPKARQARPSHFLAHSNSNRGKLLQLRSPFAASLPLTLGGPLRARSVSVSPKLACTLWYMHISSCPVAAAALGAPSLALPGTCVHTLNGRPWCRAGGGLPCRTSVGVCLRYVVVGLCAINLPSQHPRRLLSMHC